MCVKHMDICLLYRDILYHSPAADVFLETVQVPSKSGTDQSTVMSVCAHVHRHEPAFVSVLATCYEKRVSP